MPWLLLLAHLWQWVTVTHPQRVCGIYSGAGTVPGPQALVEEGDWTLAPQHLVYYTLWEVSLAWMLQSFRLRELPNYTSSCFR